jgi:nucleotide-binding universal stress UspA family protein
MGAYQTVLVGTDGSESSYRAVDRAADIARDSVARLVIVCAYHPASKREVACPRRPWSSGSPTSSATPAWPGITTRPNWLLVRPPARMTLVA